MDARFQMCEHYVQAMSVFLWWRLKAPPHHAAAGGAALTKGKAGCNWQRRH